MSLIKVMMSFKCYDIVFSSTKAVYGDNKKCHEDHSIKPDSAYGKMKAQFEDFLKDCCDKNKKFSAICLRYFNVVGAHRSGVLGRLPKDERVEEKET